MRIYQNLVFYIPWCYTKHTRHPRRKDILGFSLKYFVPILLFLAWRDFTWPRLILGFLLTYDLYEIGYIENDCETIKKEQNPTMRVSSEELVYYEKNKELIYFTKVVIAVAISVYLLIWEKTNYLFLLFPALLVPSYLIYNRMRCRWNLVIHALLMFIRYYAPVLIAMHFFSWTDALAFLFVYPIKGMIELSVMGKFGGYKNQFVKKYILRDFSNFQQYRFKYYTFGTIATGILLWFHKVDFSVFIIYAYFLLFTLISMNTIGKHKSKTQHL